MTLAVENRRPPCTRAFARAACAFGLGLLASGAQASLVNNGSFESPLVPLGSYTRYAAGSTDLASWSVLGIDAALVSGSFVQSGIIFQAQDGNQWLDLAAVTSNSRLNGVSQNIATTPGASYVVSFYVGSAADGQFFSAATVDLAIDGLARVSYTNPAAPTAAQDWKRFDVGFVATAASTSIAFFNGSAGNNFSTGLDNVSVNAVPEPASVALMLAALAALAACARRRPLPLPGPACPGDAGTRG